MDDGWMMGLQMGDETEPMMMTRLLLLWDETIGPYGHVACQHASIASMHLGYYLLGESIYCPLPH